MRHAAYCAFFREWDVLLTLIIITEAIPHGDLPLQEHQLVVDGTIVPLRLQNVYPGQVGLCGQPATAFRAGFTAQGLPIGVRAIEPYPEDRTPIRFAALVGREFGGYQPPPSFD
jgi:amidase